MNKNITKPVSSLETKSLNTKDINDDSVLVINKDTHEGSEDDSEEEECFERKPMKLKDLILYFRKDMIENGCYAFHLHFRYNSKIIMCRGYDPDNDTRVEMSYTKFIKSIPDLYVRRMSLDIGGPNTWCFRVEIWLEDKDFNPDK